MSRRLALQVAGAVALVLTAGGCGTGGHPAVSGTVTVNGAPLDDGAVTFVPSGSDLSGRTKCGATVVKGQYAFPSDRSPLPGAYKVEVRWLKKTGNKKPSGDGDVKVDETTEGLPPKYNDKSELTAEVKSGSNQIDFALKP